MRNTLKLLILVMLTASLTSCEKIKSWFDVEVDTSYDGELYIVSDETELKSTNDYGFDVTVTEQIMNDDLYEHEDKIQGFRTSDVTFEVLSVDSSDVVLRAGSQFVISNVNNPGLSVEFPTDWSVVQGASVTLSDEAMDVIDDILDDRIDFTVHAVGACNKPGVTIELRYGIETTVIASPFD
jgi:hypothetical protein